MSQPTILPGGVWESLLPTAFMLIDEISIHGGIKEPQFTFGGGTVLMLRYNHRYSKDIDIFVPDPQYLGYVTPRLCDLADSLCDSQYAEAANFVKLQLAQGEIDFVASLNLLPDIHAFEQWDLFGRSVKVETAAEIIAKKMYHRGDQATPRDLFDLAMVIETDTAALRFAHHFLYRHLDAFTANLEKRVQQMKQRFKAIETLAYDPTFEHAIDVVKKYCKKIQNIRQRSEESAFAFLALRHLPHKICDITKGNYAGQILYRSDRHIVQGIDAGSAIVHDIAAFGLSTAEECTVGKDVRLKYRNGHLTATAMSL